MVKLSIEEEAEEVELSLEGVKLSTKEEVVSRLSLSVFSLNFFVFFYFVWLVTFNDVLSILIEIKKEKRLTKKWYQYGSLPLSSKVNPKANVKDPESMESVRKGRKTYVKNL